jgi:curli biogenesis system outer membrane secretion channel CsgG
VTSPKKPDLHEPLPLVITPDEIFNTCLHGAHVADADFSSAVIPDVASEILIAENKKTGNAARFARLTLVEFLQYVVEVQIGNVFIFGSWQWVEGEASQVEVEYCREQARNAFIQAASLVGKRVERGLIVR